MIIDDDDLELVVVLLKAALDCTAEELRLTEAWDDDANEH